MRVTKLIREYVEDEVKAKFNQKRKEVSKEYEARKNEVFDKVRDIANEANARAAVIVKDAGLTRNRYSADTDIKVIETSLYGLIIQSEEDKLFELRQKEADTINSILISLEIGEASKNDLKDLLDAVTV